MEDTINKKRVKKEYSPEFKAEAVRLVTSGERNCSEVARNLGVAASTVRTWCCLARSARDVAKGGGEDVFSENKRLESEVRRLKMEQEILKKAATYFAKNLM